MTTSASSFSFATEAAPAATNYQSAATTEVRYITPTRAAISRPRQITRYLFFELS